MTAAWSWFCKHVRGIKLACAVLLQLPCSTPVMAQSPVAIGAPLTGEVVLNRDIEVRIGPNENARIIRTLPRGKALNALGTPRGTNWTEVAIGGQSIGYVPAESLDPASMVLLNKSGRR